MKYVHGGDIYTYEGLMDFSVNINPLGPDKKVVEAAKEALDHMEHYPDSRCTKVRECLSDAISLPQEMLIFGNGAADLIFSLVLAKKPKRAMIVVPAFAEYEQALKTVECEICYYRLQEKDNFYLTEKVLDELSEDLDMVFLCSPGNPCGAVIQKELLKKILTKCEEENIQMMLDECFWEFAYDDIEKTMQSEISGSKNLFLLRAFTKMHAIPGLRLGFGISSDGELLDRMERVRQPWSVSTPAQEAGIAALSEPGRVKKTREYLAGERRWMEGELTRLGIRYYPSEANYLLLYSEKDLFGMLMEKGFLIRDCGNYRGLSKGYYRIAIRTRRENQMLVKALEEIV